MDELPGGVDVQYSGSTSYDFDVGVSQLTLTVVEPKAENIPSRKEKKTKQPPTFAERIDYLVVSPPRLSDDQWKMKTFSSGNSDDALSVARIGKRVDEKITKQMSRKFHSFKAEGIIKNVVKKISPITPQQDTARTRANDFLQLNDELLLGLVVGYAKHLGIQDADWTTETGKRKILSILGVSAPQLRTLGKTAHELFDKTITPRNKRIPHGQFVCGVEIARQCLKKGITIEANDVDSFLFGFVEQGKDGAAQEKEHYEKYKGKAVLLLVKSILQNEKAISRWRDKIISALSLDPSKQRLAKRMNSHEFQAFLIKELSSDEFRLMNFGNVLLLLLPEAVKFGLGSVAGLQYRTDTDVVLKKIEHEKQEKLKAKRGREQTISELLVGFEGERERGGDSENDPNWYTRFENNLAIALQTGEAATAFGAYLPNDPKYSDRLLEGYARLDLSQSPYFAKLLSKETDPLLGSVVFYLRDYLGLDEETLTELSKPENRGKAQARYRKLRDAVSPSVISAVCNYFSSDALLDPSERTSLQKYHAQIILPWFVARQRKSEGVDEDVQAYILVNQRQFYESYVVGNVWRDTIGVGRIVAHSILSTGASKQEYLNRIQSDFQKSIQEENSGVEELREEIENQPHSRVRRKSAFAALKKLKLGKRVEQILHSPEGTQLFPTNPDKTFMQKVKGLGIDVLPGWLLSRLDYEATTNVLDLAPNRIRQVSEIALWYFLSRNIRSGMSTKELLTKGINWHEAAKTTLRGAIGGAVVFGTELALVNVFNSLGLFGVDPSTMLQHKADILQFGAQIALQAGTLFWFSKVMADQVLASSGIRTGIESMMNGLLYQKGHLDNIANVLHFKDGEEPKVTKAVLNKRVEAIRKQPVGKGFSRLGKAVLRHVGGEKKQLVEAEALQLVHRLVHDSELERLDFSFKELCAIARTLSFAKTELTILMSCNGTRYGKRIVQTDRSKEIIDNREVIRRVDRLRQKLLRYSRAHFERAKCEELEIYLGLATKDLQNMSQHKWKRMREYVMVSGIWNMGLFAGLLGYGPKVADALLGELKPTSGIPLDSVPRFEAGVGDVFHADISKPLELLKEDALRTQELYNIMAQYHRADLSETDKFVLLMRNDMYKGDLEQLEKLLQQNNLSITDLKVLMNLAVVAQKETTFTRNVGIALSTTKHTNIGQLVRTLASYKGTGLQRELRSHVQELGLEGQTFKTNVDGNGYDLARRLGLDTKSVDFQLSYLPISQDQEREMALLAQGNGVAVIPYKDQLGAAHHVVSLAQDGGYAVYEFTGNPATFLYQKDQFSIGLLADILKNSSDEDLRKALQKPAYARFMGEVVDAWIHDAKMGADEAGRRYLYDNLVNPDVAYRKEYFIALYNAAIQYGGLSPSKAKELLVKAAQGDARSFNEVYDTISQRNPGIAFNRFGIPQRDDDNVVEQVVAASKSNNSKTDVRGLFIHNTHITVAQGEFNVKPLLDEGKKINPYVVDFQLAGKLEDPREGLKTALTGTAPLDTILERQLGSPVRTFLKDGVVEGQYRTFLQLKLPYVPNHLAYYIVNVEGKDMEPSEYFPKFFLQNAKAWLDPNVPFAGRSGPAQQLTELIAGSPLLFQSTLGSDPAMLPKLYHPEKYGIPYMFKLMTSALAGITPKEMTDAVTGISVPSAAPDKEVNPFIYGDTPFKQWLGMFFQDEVKTTTPSTDIEAIRAARLLAAHQEKSFNDLSDTELNRIVKTLCAKFESYIISRQLLKVYGSDAGSDLMNAYINYVPMGNTVEGVPIYGFEAAALYYFGKSSLTLTEGETLMLTGLIQGPSNYSPIFHISKEVLVGQEVKLPDNTMHIVTKAEVESGFIAVPSLMKNRAKQLVIQTLAQKGIKDERSVQLLKDIEDAKFTLKIPKELENKIPKEGGYTALAKARPGVTSIDTGTVISNTASVKPLNITPIHIENAENTTQSTVDAMFNGYFHTVDAEVLSRDVSPSTKVLYDSAITMSEILNNALNQGLKGEKLGGYVRASLEQQGVHISKGSALDVQINELVNATASGELPPQCVNGANLLGALLSPVLKTFSYIGNWEVVPGSKVGITQARLYVTSLFNQSQVEYKFPDRSGYVGIKMNSVSQALPGDYVFAKDLGIDGHMAVVIDKGVKKTGEQFITIYDQNFNGDGKSRIVTMTDADFQQLIAKAAKGQKAAIGIIRTIAANDNPEVIQGYVARKSIKNIAPYYEVTLAPGSPISRTYVPKWEYKDLLSGEKRSVPGMALVVQDTSDQILASEDPTGILGSYPIQPGSTIKPFMAVFLGYKLSEYKGKPFDPSVTQLPNWPSASWTLDGSTQLKQITNPYEQLNSVNTMTLDYALAVSSNDAFQAGMKYYFDNYPPGGGKGRQMAWNELQMFMETKFGLEFVDIMGKKITKPMPLTAIGHGVYVRNLSSLARGYAILAKPEEFLRDDSEDTKKLIASVDHVRGVLGDDSLKAQKHVQTGFQLNATSRALMSSTVNGKSNAAFIKTGTVGGVNGTTGVLTVAGMPDPKNPQKFIIVASVAAGQDVGNDGKYYEVDIDKKLPPDTAWGSIVTLPIVRDIIAKLSAAK